MYKFYAIILYKILSRFVHPSVSFADPISFNRKDFASIPQATRRNTDEKVVSSPEEFSLSKK